MDEQRHRICREVIELVTSSEDAADRLQTALSGMHQQRVVPMIERCLSGVSAPGRLHRIDRLVVDLGMLVSPDPAEEFVARLGPALSRSLSEQVDALESSSSRDGIGLAVASQIELLTEFGRTGELPWWADSSGLRLVNEAIVCLLQDGPRELVKLIFELRGQRGALQRIVRHSSDVSLGTLLELLAEEARPGLERGPLDARWIIGAPQCVPGAGVTGFRNAVWETLLYAISGTRPSGGEVELWREVIARIATKYQTPQSRLAAGLVQVALRRQDSPIPSPPLLSALESLCSPPHLKGLAEDVARETTALLADLAAALAGAGLETSQVNQLVGSFKEHAARLPSRERRMLEEEIQRLRQAGQIEHKSDLIQRIERLMADLAAKSEDIAARAAQSRSEAPGEREGEASWPDQAASLSSGEAGAAYVENAGLVLLWPFLQTLFERRELVRNGRFVGEPARHRAAGLLGFLASGDRFPAEYQVTLNKLLCGIEAARVFEFDEPVNEEEAAECTNLLKAVIGHAKILRDMSADGFRGTFLLRSGVLTADTGAWLLRVERKTHDIVLDHFPWSWEWVKFPWMEAPLRVEW